MYRFENLEVWQLSLEYSDMVYNTAEKSPKIEEFNLKSQRIRAATWISLNIAEGSTGQSDAEQNRFLGMGLWSLVETVACMKLVGRRNYVDEEAVGALCVLSEKLFAELSAFRKAIRNIG